MKSSHVKLGRAEFHILQYVIEHQPATARATADHFCRETGLARTTVLTVIERLRQKGYLTRKRVRGIFHYSAKVPQEDILQSLVCDFVEETLGGSLSPFVAYLARTTNVSDARLEELRRLVRELDQQRRGDSP
jgi:predicted transcriptional regulator